VLVNGATDSLQTGDPVLVWRPDSEIGSGVVLGRVGAPATARRDRSPGDDVSDDFIVETKKTLSLKCGESSILLRADGKILIEGKELVSHAKNVNRIKGGAVAIN
jgi:hypothetical protein